MLHTDIPATLQAPMAGAHLLTVRADKRPLRNAWQAFPEPWEAVAAHLEAGGLVGLMPGSIGLLCMDADLPSGWKKLLAVGADLSALIEPYIAQSRARIIETLGQPLYEYRTRSGGAHLFFAMPGERFPYAKAKWRIGQFEGDVIADSGFAILWPGRSAIDALAAIDFTRYGPIDLNRVEALKQEWKNHSDANSQPGATGWEPGNRNNRAFQEAKDAGKANDTEAYQAVFDKAHESGLVSEDGIEAVTATLESGWRAGAREAESIRAGFDILPEAPAGNESVEYRAPGQDRFAESWRIKCGADFRFTRNDHKAVRQFIAGDGWRAGELAIAAALDTMRGRIRAMTLGDDSKASRWLTESHIKASVRLAASMPGMILEAHRWDADPDLAGIPGGRTVDLRSGAVLEADRDRFMVRRMGAAPARVPAPLFDSLLQMVTAGEEAFLRALRAVAGSAATGRAVKAFILLLGGADTGKTQFALTVQFALKDYAQGMRADTLAGRGNQHPTDIAAVEGARGIFASEFKGGTWSIDRLKSLTGGDMITAHKMHQDERTFAPSHTLIAYLNPADLPSSAKLDDAMKTRFRVLPFDNKIQQSRFRMVDHLAEAIRDAGELPAVVAWIIDGARDVLANGLLPILDSCSAVRAATAKWQAGQDHVARWIEENCETGLGKRENRTALYRNYKVYVATSELPIMSNQEFYRDLEERGYQQRGREFFGIGFPPVIIPP